MEGIQIHNITKHYHDITALDHVSFTLEKGKIYGLLGRNGAGKSTLINIIANRIFADEGDVLIDDQPAKENIAMHELIHCMSEADLWTNLKVEKIFHWASRFYTCFDLEKAYDIAQKFNLPVNKNIKSLSTGYQSIFKLTFALALHTPYVIFDEPVLGLDANHRELFYQLLLEDYETNQRTIILATHLIEEIANLIEDVIMIDKGKLLLLDSVESIMSKGYSVAGSFSDVDAYCKGKNVIGYDELGGLKLAYIMGNKEESSLPSLQFSTMNLQKLFVKLTKKGDH